MAKRLTIKEKNKELLKQGKELNHYGLVLRLEPNKEQMVLINKTIGSARLIFNLYLNERQNFYKDTGKTLSIANYKKSYLNPMKQTDDYIFLKEVDKFALEASVEAVDDAYDRFFKGQNRFPRFKSKHKSRKSYTSKQTNNNIEVLDGFVKLPKLGLVKFSRPNKVGNSLSKAISKDAKIKKATISENAGNYYVSFLCEEIIDIVEPLEISGIDLNNVIGIDLGLTDFATVINGDASKKFANPKYLKQSEEKLNKLQRKLSKKEKGSKNFIKAKKKVAKLHQDITNQRIDFAHQLSRKLVNENQVIVVEDLNIKGMVKNKNLAKAISDAGWSRFITFLKYKLEKDGKYLVKIDRWFASSKLCSSCNEKNIMLTLNDREWVCSSCGTHLDRDVNAAINIRKEGLRLLNIA